MFLDQSVPFSAAAAAANIHYNSCSSATNNRSRENNIYKQLAICIIIQVLVFLLQSFTDDIVSIK
jgi:hypothetical protein